ncbi:MAG TPA: dihydrolipoamide acetyltransferase family protein [Microbacteriaceae bacterium]
MSVQVFTLPDLGEGLSEAELVRWLVAVGDTITVDQPVAEVETAKSVVEVPSPFAGVVETLHGTEGEALTVGAPLVSVAEVSVAEVSVAELAEAPAAGSGNVLVGYGTTETVHSTRHRRRRGANAAHGGRVASASERIETSDTGLDTLVPRYSTSDSPRYSTSNAPVAVSSPVIRQLARTRGLDLTTVTPSGPGGIITRSDVESASAQPSPRSDVDPPAGLTIRATTPLSLFRRTVAANMTRSRSEIPEATVWVDVDATELRELRRRIRIGEKHPSVVALIARFTLTALGRYPVLAARLSPDAASLIEFDGVNLGIAADTPRGLVVPVIRAANTLTLRELDAELARLTSAARYGTASAAELTGSTFTINNYGTLGVDGSAAIINYPEVAILGIGRMLERPWVVDGQIVPRTIAQLSLVFDHRVCDGGTAAGFLRMIADAVEHPYDAFADL